MFSPDQQAMTLFRRWHRLGTRLFIDGQLPDGAHSPTIDSHCTIANMPVDVLIVNLGDSKELVEVPISGADLELNADVTPERADDGWAFIRKRDNSWSLAFSTTN